MLLDDAILKLQRGEKQRDNLFSQLKDILAKDPAKLELKRNTQLGYSTSTFEYDCCVSYIPVIEKDIGILLGETIQSFRICLDYLAWALVQAYGKKLNSKEEKAIAFPMSETGENFASNIKKNLPYVSDIQKATVEKYQPYQNSDEGIAIRYLQILSNTDKHRIIVPVFISPLTVESVFNPVGVHILEVKKAYTDGQELSIGTKILTIVTDGEPKSWRSKVEARLVPAISRSIIEPPPQYALVTLEKVLDIIRTTCFTIISEFRLIA